jgi:ribosome-associated heat shock protein Hsp15
MNATSRIDKWLWHARFYRNRAAAQAVTKTGLIRVNGHRIEKSSVAVGPGDVVTLPKGREVLVVRVRALAERRGTSRDGQSLYEIVAETPA